MQVCSESKKSIDIIEGADGVDLIYQIIKDQTCNLIKAVIIDENMEYVNGSEAITFIRKLQSLNKVKNIYISSITAFEDEFNKRNIMKSGADDILSKPCKKSAVQNIIANNFI